MSSFETLPVGSWISLTTAVKEEVRKRKRLGKLRRNRKLLQKKELANDGGENTSFVVSIINTNEIRWRDGVHTASPDLLFTSVKG